MSLDASRKNEIFSLPLIFYSRYNLIYVAFLFFLHGVEIKYFVLLLETGKHNQAWMISLKVILITLLFWLVAIDFDFINAHILRRQYLELNDFGLRYKNLFVERNLFWEEIQEFQIVRKRFNITYPSDYFEILGRKSDGNNVRIRILEHKYKNIPLITLYNTFQQQCNNNSKN